MGKKKITTISDTPLEAQTIGYVKKHRFAWLGAIFLLGIFACVIFFMPEIQTYVDKYLKGKNKVSNQIVEPINNEIPEEENKPEEPIPVEINYLTIADNPTFTLDDKIKFEEISYNDNAFIVKMQAIENNISLVNENYYIELYDENKELIYRKYLTDSLTSTSRIGLKISPGTIPMYYAIRKIESSEYPYIMLDIDENDTSFLTCKKNNETIKYTFISEVLKMVDDEINYINVTDDMKTFYENKVNTLNSNEGISASLENNGNNTIFLVNIDMNSYNSMQSPYYFNAQVMPREVSFKMIASGFDCK